MSKFKQIFFFFKDNSRNMVWMEYETDFDREETLIIYNGVCQHYCCLTTWYNGRGQGICEAREPSFWYIFSLIHWEVDIFCNKKSWISKLWLSDNDGGVISSGRPSIWEIFQPKSLNILFF